MQKEKVQLIDNHYSSNFNNFNQNSNSKPQNILINLNYSNNDKNVESNKKLQNIIPEITNRQVLQDSIKKLKSPPVNSVNSVNLLNTTKQDFPQKNSILEVNQANPSLNSINSINFLEPQQSQQPSKDLSTNYKILLAAGGILIMLAGYKYFFLFQRIDYSDIIARFQTLVFENFLYFGFA